VDIKQRVTAKRRASPGTNYGTTTTVSNAQLPRIQEEERRSDHAQEVQSHNSDEDEVVESAITDALSAEQKRIVFDGIVRVQEAIRDISQTSGVNIEIIERL